MRLPITILSLSLFAGTAAAQECEYPGVLLVLDRSASMQGLVGRRTKWDIARDAVSDMVSERSDEIDFGLMLYPARAPTTGGRAATTSRTWGAPPQRPAARPARSCSTSGGTPPKAWGPT